MGNGGNFIPVPLQWVRHHRHHDMLLFCPAMSPNPLPPPPLPALCPVRTVGSPVSPGQRRRRHVHTALQQRCDEQLLILSHNDLRLSIFPCSLFHRHFTLCFPRLATSHHAARSGTKFTLNNTFHLSACAHKVGVYTLSRPAAAS